MRGGDDEATQWKSANCVQDLSCLNGSRDHWIVTSPKTEDSELTRRHQADTKDIVTLLSAVVADPDSIHCGCWEYQDEQNEDEQEYRKTGMEVARVPPRHIV